MYSNKQNNFEQNPGRAQKINEINKNDEIANDLEQEQQQKKRMESLSKLLQMLQQRGNQKQDQQGSQNLIEQTSKEDEKSQQNKSVDSSSSSSSKNSSQNNLNHNSIRIHQSNGNIQKEYSIQDYSQRNQRNRQSIHNPKSRFSKTNKYQHQDPIIITSSHKSFFTPSKKNINTLPASSNFLNPNTNPSLLKKKTKKELTSASNLMNENGSSDKFTSRNNLNKSSKFLKSKNDVGKSNGQITAKNTTFAELPSKNSQQVIGGVSLYQEVLAKNFQVIDNLLRKLNQIYSHQEQYQNTITQISQKLHKLEVDNQNIHHEFRTSHFMIDKKLNSISNQYSNIVQDMNLMKKMWSQNGVSGMNSYYVNSIINQDDQTDQNSKKRKNSFTKKLGHRKSSRFRKSSINRSDSINNGSTQGNQNETRSSARRLSKQRQSARKSAMMDRKKSNWKNLKGLDQQNFGKILLQQINESSSQISSSNSQNGDPFHSNTQTDEDNDYTQNKINQLEGSQQFSQSIIQSQKKNIGRKISKIGQPLRNSYFKKEGSRNKRKNHKISIDNSDLQQITQLKDYMSQEIKKSDSEQMRMFAKLGIQATIIKKFGSLEQKFQKQLQGFKKQIQNQFKISIMQEVQTKINLTLINDLNNFKIQAMQRIDKMDNRIKKQFQKKVDKQQMRQDLKQILQSMNKRVNNLMEECYNKFAQRQETKRAILFLQKKINKVIEAEKRFNLQASMEVNQNVKCLSCDKNIVFNASSNQIPKCTSQQPMFTQIHLQPPNLKENHQSQAFNRDQNSIQTARKNNSQRQKQNSYSLNASPNKKSIFNDATNTNNNSLNSGTNTKCHQSSIKPYNQNTKGSKELFMNKIKNVPTKQMHNLQQSHSKFLSQTLQNRPTTSNYSFNEASQKTWKQKASSMLKKQGSNTAISTSTNWRSKSTHKKV